MPYIDNKAWLLSGRIEKEEFISQFKPYVIDWIRNNEAEIFQILTDKKYSWKGESYLNSVNRRNVLEYAIKKSREANNNGVDLGTVNRITRWGFGRDFPLSDNEEALENDP